MKAPLSYNGQPTYVDDRSEFTRLTLPTLLPTQDAIDLATFEGVMEGVPHDAFSGWLWAPASSDAALEVEIFAPMFFARLTANEHRADLQAAMKRQGRCWFKVQVPAEITEADQAQAVVLLAGTAHRVRPVEEDNQELTIGWLDEQPLGVQVAVAAQRIAHGLARRPLSQQQLERLVTDVERDGFDLTRLVAAVAESEPLQAISPRRQI